MSKHKELRYIEGREIRVSIGNDGSRTISGVAVAYNSPSVDMGGWKEVVSPGCFKDSLANNGDCLCLRDHDPKVLLGRVKAGTLVLRDLPTGLNYSCKLPNTTQAADVAESILRKDLDGMSFGFTVAENGDKWSSDGNGLITRTLLKADLAEISVVSFPAYPAGSVSVRSCPPEFRSLIEKRQTSRDEDDDDCDCDCGPCVDGNCDDCDDADCDSDGCTCGNNEERSATTVRLLSTSELHKVQMQFALSERK